MAPLRIGSSPVSSAAGLGAQLGDATKAWVRVTPSRASRAMFGVGTSLPPYGEQSAHPRSSARKTTTCGGPAVAAWSARDANTTAIGMNLFKGCYDRAARLTFSVTLLSLRCSTVAVRSVVDGSEYLESMCPGA